MAWLWMLATNLITGLILVNDVKIFGINEDVTFYIGSEIPVWATVNEEATNQDIEWVLNFSEFMNIFATGNQAVLKPISEGGVNIMARALDGSDASRSIYALIQNYQSTTSSFSISAGIKPIMESGINDKIFQVEVDPNLSENEQIDALKQYLYQINQHGTITIESKEALLDNYTLYHLKISGYPQLTLQVRLDKREIATYDQLVSIIENRLYQQEVPPFEEDETKPPVEENHQNNSNDDSLSNEDDVQEQETKPPVEENYQNNSNEESVVEQNEVQKPQTDSNSFGNIQDEIVQLEQELNQKENTVMGSVLPPVEDELFNGLEGNGTQDSPYQVTLSNLFENRRLLRFIQDGLQTGNTSLYQLFEDENWWKYGLKVLVEENGLANEFYIELVVSKEEAETVSPLVEMLLEKTNNTRTVLAQDIDSLDESFESSNPNLLEIQKVLSKVEDSQDFSKRYFVAGIACSSLVFSLLILRRKI